MKLRHLFASICLCCGIQESFMAQSQSAPAPLWSFSFGNCARPSEGGWEGGSGPTSIQTHEPTAYNTGVNFIAHTPKFLDIDEEDFSFNYQHRINGRQSPFSINLFAFKEKLNYDNNHYNNEAPLHANLGASLNSPFLANTYWWKIYGSVTAGAGGIFGAPRMDDNPATPDTMHPGHYLPYGQVIHHGGFVLIPPTEVNAPRYWMTGITETLIARINIAVGRHLLVYLGARTTGSEFFQQATTYALIPRTNKLTLGGEYGLVFYRN